MHDFAEFVRIAHRAFTRPAGEARAPGGEGARGAGALASADTNMLVRREYRARRCSDGMMLWTMP